MDRARKHGRYGHRDATMILVAYRHGLGASGVCDLRWQQIELSEGRMHVHRVKSGIPSVHPVRVDEMRALRKLRRDHPRDARSSLLMSPVFFYQIWSRVRKQRRFSCQRSRKRQPKRKPRGGPCTSADSCRTKRLAGRVGLWPGCQANFPKDI
jgi:integrase